ncbi:MAG: prefoldin subunit beta [Candidatus Micrarchaeota archaeon]|nr:prefoldin subunit beta [Candidatus Micrarchaeota archaeon]
MATEPLRDPQKLQKQLAEFQEVQRQLQLINIQRQQLTFQLEEVKAAQEELAKTDKKVYRAIGPLIVEGTKEEIAEDLKQRREIFEVRLSALAKQGEKLQPKFDELRASIEKMISQGGQSQ